MTQQRLFIFLFVASVFTVILLPTVSMIINSFWNEGSLDLSAYMVLLQGSTLKSFQNSLLLSTSVATASTLAGVCLGILLGKSRLRFTYLLIGLFTLPLLIPPYMLALGWYTVLGREGFFGEILFGFWGTFWVLFSIYLPIPMLLTILFLKQINPRLEEAAVMMVSWRKVLRFITLPLIFPAISLSFLLVFILSFGEQSVANFLRFDVFALESFTYFSAFYDFRTATILAMPMVVVALIVLVTKQFLVHRHPLRFDTAYTPNIIDLGKLQLPILLLMLLFVSVIVILPFSQLFLEGTDLQTLTKTFTKALYPMLRSYLYAALGATLLVCFGFLIGYVIEEKMYGYRVYDTSLVFMFALPATVIGIALILFWNRPYTNIVYATPLIILLGYLGKYLLLTSKITQHRLSQIPHSQVEAAQMAGANGFQILRFILLPLSKNAMLVAWLIGFIFSLRETTITMLVYPPGYETLPVYTLTQMANGEPKSIAALSVIMILMTLLPLLVLGRFTKVLHD